MKPARNLVAVLVKFPAGVQRGQDDFCCGPIFCRMLVRGNAPAVVMNTDGVVAMNRDEDL